MLCMPVRARSACCRGRYGLEDLAESAMAKFTAGLEFFKADSLYCNTVWACVLLARSFPSSFTIRVPGLQMGRLLFLFEPLTAIHCSTYLSMLAELSAMGSSPADITWSQDGLNVLVCMRAFVYLSMCVCVAGVI